MPLDTSHVLILPPPLTGKLTSKAVLQFLGTNRSYLPVYQHYKACVPYTRVLYVSKISVKYVFILILVYHSISNSIDLKSTKKIKQIIIYCIQAASNIPNYPVK